MSDLTIEVTNDAPENLEADWLVLTVPEGETLPESVTALDGVLDGKISRIIESEDFSPSFGELVAVPDLPALKAGRLLLIGLGEPEELDAAKVLKAFTKAALRISKKKDRRVAVVLPSGLPLPAERVAELAATGFVVGSVGQAFHKAEPKHHPIAELTFRTADDPDSLGEVVQRGVIIGQSMNITRELVNRPAGEIYPESFADRADALAEGHGLECTILGEDEMHDEQMGSLLAVAMGSDREARLVMLKHMNGGEDAPTIALCGKGVTFDSGGLSLKPSAGMLTMKCDMAGAATVLGTMVAIARLNLPVNVIGLMGLVENMVSGSSFKLGDILTARNGTTIEVLNTDAEGRLVLADVLSYAVDQGATHLVDLATLTGACVVALGEDITGVFTNDQPWCDRVLASATEAGELAWQLPMHEHFGKLLDSEVADTKNVGPRWGGATTAAKFLEKFVAETPWVHLDIAGPSFAENTSASREGGGTGVMVRTLVELLSNNSGN